MCDWADLEAELSGLTCTKTVELPKAICVKCKKRNVVLKRVSGICNGCLRAEKPYVSVKR
jgi:hypothetical protein